MRFLFDLLHPSHALLFHHPARILRARGHEVLMASRVKDVTVPLLERLGDAHVVLSSAGKGLAGLGIELAVRDWEMLRLVRRWKPDVLGGMGCTAAAHIGWLLKKPVLCWDDTEVAKLQTGLTFPFVTELLVPDSYDVAATKKARVVKRFPGIKELSYFAPSRFAFDAARAARAGLQAGRDNVLIRLVNWNANHDVGKAGWSLPVLEAVLADLQARGAAVQISSERPLPDSLAHLAYRGAVEDIHHLLAGCRLYLGESATMAAEAVALGVPSIFAGSDTRGYTLDLSRRNLMRAPAPGWTAEQLLGDMAALLAEPLESYKTRHSAWLSAMPDLAETIANEMQGVLGGGAASP